MASDKRSQCQSEYRRIIKTLIRDQVDDQVYILRVRSCVCLLQPVFNNECSSVWPLSLFKWSYEPRVDNGKVDTAVLSAAFYTTRVHHCLPSAMIPKTRTT